MFALALVMSASLAGAPNANKPTQLKLDIQPETAIVFVDGKKKGKGGKVLTLNVTPGNHTVKVVNKKDEHEEVVPVKKGEQKTYQWEFEDELEERKAEAEEKKKSAKEGETEGVEAPKKVGDQPANEDDILAPKK